MIQYQIVVRGTVEAARLPLLDGARVRCSDRQTTIEVNIADQSHLDGVLAMLRDRGSALVSVHPMTRDHGDGAAS